MPRLSLRAFIVAAGLLLPVGGMVTSNPAWAHPAPDGFADLAAKLLPAVVNISSSSKLPPAEAGRGPDLPNFPPGSPFEKFFRDFMRRHGDQLPQDGEGGNDDATPAQPQRMQSLGSGFIIDPAGYIVTNNHVIANADRITVTLQDNTTLTAKLVGADPRTDLALLKVDAGHKLPFVTFGDSGQARVGNWVLAIGNPFGLGGTVTAGIVSARGRNINEGPYDDFIQTDAPINRGNSGGPLFDMAGQVIGINTAIYSPSGGSIGIGFSIPSNMAKLVVAQLRSFGHARRGWLGVRIQEVTPDIAESLGLKPAAGAMVAGVLPDSPASKALLHDGDVILRFDGQKVPDMHALPRIVAETPIGQTVPVVVWRDGADKTLTATVAELLPPKPVLPVSKPVAPPPVHKPGQFGLTLVPLDAPTRQKFQLAPTQKGVVVTYVAPDSVAADRGIRPGDVIVEVQQQDVASPADVARMVAQVRKLGRQAVLMLIQSQDGLRWVPLSLDADKKKG